MGQALWSDDLEHAVEARMVPRGHRSLLILEITNAAAPVVLPKIGRLIEDHPTDLRVVTFEPPP